MELNDAVGLPAPKLRNLQIWMLGESSKASKDSTEIWEIGVPAKNGLFWSLIMSYLLAEGNQSEGALKKLIGDGNETSEVKKKKNMSPRKIHLKEVQREVMKFNPFKNRHVAFFWQNLIEVLRIFKLRLNRYANKSKVRGGEWNDEIKLQAAAEMLDCQILVYLPDETDHRKSYSNRDISNNTSPKITLFQYKDQKYKSRTEKCNIFRFGMELQYAHLLKIKALGHILEKAKFSKDVILKIKQLMNHPETHGKGFLPTLLQSECVEVIPNLYKSPYIVLKLSEAGFETDPTATRDENPSPLCYALANTNRKYIQILYNYATNCRCLFDRCITSNDDTILQNLKSLKGILENDILKINCCEFREDTKRKAVDTLKQFSRFAEYQTEAVFTAVQLKNELSSQTKSNDFHFRKGIIESVINCYLKYFYYGSPNSNDFFQKFANYLDYTEFYENIDIFASISFFDNFYSLKCWFGITIESNFLKIEWLLFLAMMSNKYFTKYDHYANCKDNHDSRKCEQEKSILRIIPLVHRMSIENTFKCLLSELKDTEIPKTVPPSISKDKCAFPQIIDALLISRLQMYISAALDESNQMNNIGHILAIERAFQVIGESLKPPSVKSSVVSFLLCARLPTDLKIAFIKIRNKLSKCIPKLIYGRLKVEKQVSFWNDVKSELKVVQNAFEIVDFTQDLRIEESIINNCMTELKKYTFETDTVHSFQKYCELRNKARKNKYKMHHSECMQLLRDIVTDLREGIMQDEPSATLRDERLGQLKAIEYLLNFICKNKNDSNLDNLLEKVKHFNKRPDAESAAMKSDLMPFLSRISEKLKDITGNLKSFKADLSTSTPKIKNFLSVLNENEYVDKNACSGENEVSPEHENEFSPEYEKEFSPEEQNEIKDAVEAAYNEASKATENLKSIFNENNYTKLCEDEIECLFRRILFSEENTKKLRSFYESRDAEQALICLKKSNLSDKLNESILGKLKSGSNVDGYARMLLLKIVFPDAQGKSFYESITLSEKVTEKLRNCLTKRAHFLLDRLRALKTILIDDDEEIEAAWKFGKSKGMKYHMKFLMRQCYMRENMVRASLEMAFFDCLNILNRKDLQNLYDKSTHLFRGINLRNVISHRFSSPEIVGAILDEDDFPSEMINKILELIEDSKTIEYLLELFEKYGIFDRKAFESYIKKALNDESLDSKLNETIQKCKNWESYLSVLPLL